MSRRNPGSVRASRPKLAVLLAVGVGVPLLALGGFFILRDDPPPAPTGALELHPVAGSFKPDDTKVAECSPGEGDEARCLEQAYGNLSYDEGPKRALAAFTPDMAAGGAAETDCHRIVHTIGSAALARYDGDVGRAFTEGDATCWSGYYHGILERALIGAKNDSELRAAVRGICEEIVATATPYIAYQCVHGIGHGLMIQTGLALDRSLQGCEGLSTPWEQTSCDGGVFMENFNTSYGVKSPYLRDDDPVYPCNTVAERHKLYCYLQITDHVLPSTKYDWHRTSTWCTRSEARWRATCFQSFGRSVSGTSRGDVPRLVSLCSIPSPRDRGDCVYGVARDLVSQDAGATRAAGFCRAAPERGRCFDGIGTILATLSTDPTATRAACSKAGAAAARDRAACLRGAGVA